MKILQASTIPKFPKIRGDRHNIRFPCYAELKYDGEANIYYQGCLISKSSGKVRTNFPVTDRLSKIFDKDTMLFGELYWGSGEFGMLYKFLSNQNSDALRYIIFDIYHPTLKGATYEDRRSFLLKHKLEANDVVSTWYCEDEEELNRIIRISKDVTFEGIVAKNRDSVLFSSSMIEVQIGWCKIKHKTTVDLPLVYLDPTLERGEVEYMGKRVGVKIQSKYKAILKVGDLLEIEHQGVLSGGSLRHPVYRGKVTFANIGGSNGQSNTAQSKQEDKQDSKEHVQNPSNYHGKN